MTSTGILWAIVLIVAIIYLLTVQWEGPSE